MKVSQKVRLLNLKRQKATLWISLEKLSKEHQNNPIIGYLNIIVCAIKLMT